MDWSNRFRRIEGESLQLIFQLAFKVRLIFLYNQQFNYRGGNAVTTDIPITYQVTGRAWWEGQLR